MLCEKISRTILGELVMQMVISSFVLVLTGCTKSCASFYAGSPPYCVVGIRNKAALWPLPAVLHQHLLPN